MSERAFTRPSTPLDVAGRPAEGDCPNEPLRRLTLRNLREFVSIGYGTLVLPVSSDRPDESVTVGCHADSAFAQTAQWAVIHDLAFRLGLCKAGEISPELGYAIRNRVCVNRGLTPAEADDLSLDEVVAALQCELTERPALPNRDFADSSPEKSARVGLGSTPANEPRPAQSPKSNPPVTDTTTAPPACAARPADKETRRVPRPEREKLVGDCLKELTQATDGTSKEDRIRKVRIEGVMARTNLAKSSVGSTDAWRAFEAERKDRGLSPTSGRSKGPNPIPLTDPMLAAISDTSAADPAELADERSEEASAWQHILDMAMTSEERECLERMTPDERRELIQLRREQSEQDRQDPRPRRNRA
jgi:hypothetical protein